MLGKYTHSVRKLAKFATPLALAAMIASCGENGSGSQVVVPAPLPSTTSTSTPTPTATSVSYNVDRCFTQAIQGENGATLTSILIPDTLKVDLTRTSHYPNGRDPDDQVIDILLATLLLDMTVTGQGPNTLAGVPLNPPTNDKPFSVTFPFFAPPNGAPQIASGTGSGFNFRNDPDSGYVSVDRMGNPAVATVLIGSSMKLAFNDDTPTGDVTNQKYLAEYKNELHKLFDLIGDDLENLQLKICATKS
jgi:hypothetical protein